MTHVIDCDVCFGIFEVRTKKQFDEMLEKVEDKIICRHCLSELAKGNNPFNSAVICHE